MAILQSLKERFTEREHQRQLSAEQTYRQVIERLADGEEPSVDDVEAALAAGERTIDQLEADVSLLKQRRVLAEQLTDAEDARKELHDVQKRQKAEDDRFDQLRAEYKQLSAQLATERLTLEGRIRVAETARHQLITTCNDAVILKKQADINGRLKVIVDRLNQLRETEASRKNGEMTPHEIGERARLRSQASGLQAALDKIDREKLVP